MRAIFFNLIKFLIEQLNCAPPTTYLLVKNLDWLIYQGWTKQNIDGDSQCSVYVRGPTSWWLSPCGILFSGSVLLALLWNKKWSYVLALHLLNWYCRKVTLLRPKKGAMFLLCVIVTCYMWFFLNLFILWNMKDLSSLIFFLFFYIRFHMVPRG